MVTRATGAVQLAENSDERGSQGVVGLDELDLNCGRVGGDDLTRGAGGGPGVGVVSASNNELAGITFGRDGVVEVGVVGDDGLDGGSEGQSGSDDGLGEHYGYVKEEGVGSDGLEEMEKTKREEKKEMGRDQSIFKGNLSERKKRLLLSGGMEEGWISYARQTGSKHRCRTRCKTR